MAVGNEHVDATFGDAIARERRRIQYGASRDEQPELAVLDQVIVRGPGNARVVLDRTREVLDRVLAHLQDEGLTIEQWRGFLPSWFVAASAQEHLRDSTDPWDAELSRIPHEQQLQWVLEHPRPAPRDLGKQEAWSVSAFLYWFRPRERQWWWNAHVQDADTLIVDLMVDDDYAFGALVWLFEAAGATNVESVYGYGHE